MDRFFESLYSRFILRDLFGKIVPGSILLFTILRSLGWFPSGSLALDLPFAGWLLFYGVAWAVGIAAQSVGEITRLLKFYGGGPGELHWHRQVEAELHATPRQIEMLERNIVLKEASGNVCTATLLSLVWSATLDYVRRDVSMAQVLSDNWAPWCLALLLAIVLWRMHRHMVDVQDRFLITLLTFHSTHESGQGRTADVASNLDGGRR